MKNIDKWINEYIKDLNLNNIEWICLNAQELNIFFDNNYLDKELWKYVLDTNASKLFQNPLGMYYLSFNSPINEKKYKFLLGIVNNNINKKTIVSSIIYLDKYYLFNNQKEPLTYISTVETNKYLQNLGIYKKMCKALYNYINHNQHILTTKESELGKICHTFDILKTTLINQGFKKNIFEDNNSICNQELYNLLCSKEKVLK